MFAVRTALCGRYDNFTDLSSANCFSRISAIRKDYIVTQFFVTRASLAVQIYNKQWTKISNPYIGEVASCIAHAALARTKFLPCHFLMRGVGKHRQTTKKRDFLCQAELRRYLDDLPTLTYLREEIASAIAGVYMPRTRDSVTAGQGLIYSW